MPELSPWIETFTGKEFYFLDPTPDSIDIRDIAHSLAFCCRFTGHSKRFYSVAEHSILVSYLANDPLAGLLHDASEAYITDIASPIKPYLSNYKELEDMLMGRIASKFGFDYPFDPDIKDCDATQLKTEAKYLLKSGGIPWAHLYPTKRQHGIKPMCLSPEEAETAFLERYEEVRNVSMGSDESSNQSEYSVRLNVIEHDNFGVPHMAVHPSRSGSVYREGPCSRYEADSGGEDVGCGIPYKGPKEAARAVLKG